MNKVITNLKSQHSIIEITWIDPATLSGHLVDQSSNLMVQKTYGLFIQLLRDKHLGLKTIRVAHTIDERNVGSSTEIPIVLIKNINVIGEI